MYETVDVERYRGSPPSLIHTLTELLRFQLELGLLLNTLPALSLLPRGDGHRVLVLPGFMAGDESTVLLRRYLRFMGYKPEPWGLGLNTGRPTLLTEGIMQRVAALWAKKPERFSIIGQSLGGVFGREVGRLQPDKVRQVVTLGSPFSAKNSQSTMRLVSVLFERLSGLSVEEMREFLDDMDPEISPPVPVTAIYSREDGVAHWSACQEKQEDDHTQNIRVCGSHVGMAMNAAIYYIIADRLRQADGEWQRFDAPLIGSSRIS